MQFGVCKKDDHYELVNNLGVRFNRVLISFYMDLYLRDKWVDIMVEKYNGILDKKEIKNLNIPNSHEFKVVYWYDIKDAQDACDWLNALCLIIKLQGKECTEDLII